jgi:hypothetical protein
MSSFDRSAEAQTAPGFAEFHFDDGAYIGVAVAGETVSVIQMQGSTQGRGAAFLSVDQARALAAALNQAADTAGGTSAAAAETSAPVEEAAAS